MKELEEILAFTGESLNEGIISNVGGIIKNGVNQAVSTVSKTVNDVKTTTNNALTAASQNADQAKIDTDKSKLNQLLSSKSGISLKSNDKNTKSLVTALNSLSSMIDAKMKELETPSQEDKQVQESLAFTNILLNKLEEADNKEANNLKKFKDGITKVLGSGVAQGKGIETLVANVKKILGDSPEVNNLISTISQSYKASVDYQSSQYQKTQQQSTAKPSQPVNNQSPQPMQTPQSTQTSQQTKAPTQSQEAPQQDQVKKDTVTAQDVIKKCEAALKQITSSIDSIKNNSPNANFGVPSKEGIYEKVEGDSYIDQVKNIISKLSSDLNNYVIMKESQDKLSDLKKISEDLAETINSFNKIQ